MLIEHQVSILTQGFRHPHGFLLDQLVLHLASIDPLLYLLYITSCFQLLVGLAPVLSGGERPPTIVGTHGQVELI